MLALVAFAGEGAICLIIFGLLLLIPYYLGVVIGWAIQNSIWMRYTASLLLFAAVFMSATMVPVYNKGITVRDETIIHAPSSTVWNIITRRVPFGKSDNIFFRNGVSYPIAMQVVQQGERKALFVVYNNGTVAAPISDFQPGRSFSFGFSDTLVTMREKNFYKENNTMHIRNHFEVDYGRFEVAPINAQTCRLTTTSHFRHRFEPEFYTNWWVSYFLHGIHRHVLAGVRDRAQQTQ
jgi:hypothetical protein